MRFITNLIIKYRMKKLINSLDQLKGKLSDIDPDELKDLRDTLANLVDTGYGNELINQVIEEANQLLE